MGIFDRIFANLAAESGSPDRTMIDSTHLKAHRTAASLLKRGIHPVSSAPERRAELQAARGLRWRRISMRYDRRAHTFFSAICIAATVIFWLGQSVLTLDIDPAMPLSGTGSPGFQALP
jgi:transposase